MHPNAVKVENIKTGVQRTMQLESFKQNQREWRLVEAPKETVELLKKKAAAGAADVTAGDLSEHALLNAQVKSSPRQVSELGSEPEVKEDPFVKVGEEPVAKKRTARKKKTTLGE